MNTIAPAGNRQTGLRIWAAALIFSCLLPAGCRHVAATAPQRPSDLEAARTAFLNRDYTGARQAFERTKTKTEADLISAEYGLACVDMVTAEDKTAFLAGLERLYTRSGHDYRRENPELLIRALNQGVFLIRAADLKAGAQADGCRTRETRQRNAIIRLEKQVKTLRHQISVLENIDQELQEKRKTQ